MYLLSLIKKLYWFLFRIFVPPVCYSCSDYISEGDVLCEICYSHVYPVAPLYRKVRSYRVGIYAYAKYHGPLRKMILAKKYGKRSVFYGLAYLMKKQKVLPHLQADILIPVPLHWSRTFRRGFNQSAILAEELARFLRADLFDGASRVKELVINHLFQKLIDKKIWLQPFFSKIKSGSRASMLLLLMTYLQLGLLFYL